MLYRFKWQTLKLYRVGMNFKIILFTNNNCRAQEITTWRSLFNFRFLFKNFGAHLPATNAASLSSIWRGSIASWDVISSYIVIIIVYRRQEFESMMRNFCFYFLKLLLNLFSGCPTTWLQKCIRKIGRCLGA